MDKSGKFLLPSPKFKNLDTPPSRVRHFLSPEGIQLLPKEEQPPPMYGPRGSTVPPKFLSPLKVPTTNNQFDRKQKFFCEPCEAEFHTSTDYKVHRSEHVECEIDECRFRGHPAFMDTHIAQQHATGLYNQLKKLSTPEEIAQWRADRKKNYPTVASVEQKYKAREQRMLRGEKLELQKKNRFGNREDRRQMKGDNPTKDSEKPETNKRKRNNNKNKRQRDRKFEKKKKEEVASASPKDELSVKTEVEEERCGGIRMFKGTGGMADYKVIKKKTETNVLSSLLGMYGSDSEEDGDESSEKEELEEKVEDKFDAKVDEKHEPKNTEELSTEVPILKPEVERQIVHEESTKSQEEPTVSTQEESQDTTEKSPAPQQSKIEDLEKPVISESTEETSKESMEENTPKEEESDDEGPEEAAISKSTNIPDRPQSEPPRKKTRINPLKRNSALDYRKLRVGRQNTMLEKLLEADIRHERNVLLQCVRFVVQNNFFDKTKITPEST
ncbi:FMR1-interacting protein NUFIP1 [Eupeodes corollae]|uniref:FMR1-interacting protein NUFIP1 n=1 Tax=Eupeodes corollae TaxID=290404 RepID=UPI00249124BB|nr:FMR1-interacting protein NUFIP1 [Eupeodes corollae]